MSLRLSSVAFVAALSYCLLACGVAPRSAASGALASDRMDTGGSSTQRGAQRENGEQAAPGAGAPRAERTLGTGNGVEFVPLGEPAPEHGVGRAVSVGAAEGASAAAAAGSAREGSVAAGEDR
jgi:hypothetical protein